MDIRTLEGIDEEVVRVCFNEAFSDYSVKMDLSKEEFVSFLRDNDVSLSHSVGLFDEDKLAGFILVGVRGKRLYDSGTAILKEYRRKGYAKALLSFLISISSEYSTLELEVICDNKRAFKLYESFGFRVEKEYICFKIDNSSLPLPPPLECQEVDRCFFDNHNFKYKPSWQNEKPRDIKVYRSPDGGIIAIRDNGSVAAIEAASFEAYLGIISFALTIHPALRFVNQWDEYSKLIPESCVFTRQYGEVLQICPCI